ncbi:MAG: choice-of-anchor L domain-containing protein [Ignavibacteria bacterium]|nr:choice-of-anchor L domain-containing protein [Ignavibacteria bacterium]
MKTIDKKILSGLFTAFSVKRFLYFISFLITGVIILQYSGCSENPTDPVDPNPPVTVGIGSLSVTPDVLVVNLSDTILVKLTAANGIFFTDSLATLVKVDGSDNEISVIGNLLDNGDVDNGDDISKDNIYSGKFIITETAVGSLRLRAKGNVNTNGTTASQNTAVSALSVYGQINSGEVSLVMTTQKNAAVQLEVLLAGNPNNIENAANQLKTWLETQPGVASVEKDGSTSLIIEYTNGLGGGMIFSVDGKETRGGIESDTLRENRVTKIPADRQTIGENSYGNFKSEPDNLLLDPNTIGNRNVLIYSPYEAVWVNNERPIIINRLETSPCRDYNVTSLVNQEATVSSLFNMTDYGYIIFATHGSGGKAILTGEKVDTLAQIYIDTYRGLLQAKRISIFKNIKISSLGGVNVIADVWAIRSGFISSLANNFPNSVILNNSCESTKNPDLANAFIGKGVKTYFGYDKVVNGAFAKVIADSITKRMAVTGMTSGQAYFVASDPQSPNAQFQKSAGSSNDLKFSLSLINNDFEAGNIEGWTKIGDGRVINRLGYLNATQGTFMGIISTGLGFTEESGSISQCFTVADNQSQLTLKWNFLSEEFLEYIGSQFQDYFRIILRKQDGTEITLYSRTIDQMAAQFNATKTDPGDLISVSPNIVFDVGGVYMTNWQSSTFDVTAYRGQTIVLILICGDVGDSIYDTAILLDEIKLN